MIGILFVIPALGETKAVMLELPVILGWSWSVCGCLLRSLVVPSGQTARLIMGLTAFLQLMIPDLGVPVLVGGQLLRD